MPYIFKRILILFFIYISQGNLFAQQSRIMALLSIDESPIKYFGSFCHDSRDFIWMTNKIELYRFDGYHYKTFKHFVHLGDTILLKGIEKIQEDTEGNLWLLTRTGLFKYYPANDFFEYFKFPEKYISSISYSQQLQLIKDQYFWIGTDIGLFRFDIATKKYTHYTTQTGIGEGGVMSIFLCRNNRLFVATWEGGLSEYAWGEDRFRKINFGNLPWFPISSIREDIKGNIWLTGFFGKLYRLENDVIEHVANKTLDEHNITWNLIIDKNNTFWIIRQHGLIEYNADRNEEIFYAPKYSNIPVAVPIISGYLDEKDDILWLNTEEGPYRIYLKSWASEYKVFPRLKEHPYKFIHTIDKDGYVLYTDYQFIKMDFQGNNLKLIPRLLGIKNQWAVENFNQFKKLDLKTGLYKNEQFIPDSVVKKLHFVVDHQQVGVHRRIVLDTEHFIYYNTQSGQCNICPSKHLFSSNNSSDLRRHRWLNSDSLMVIWHNKIIIYSISKNKLLLHKELKYPVYAYTFIGDTSWMVINGNLVRYVWKNESSKTYPFSNINLVQIKIDYDKNNNIWLSDYKNVCYFDTRKEIFHRFDLGNYISLFNMSLDSTRTFMYLGGNDNLLKFNVDTFINSNSYSSIKITRFFVNNNEYHVKEFNLVRPSSEYKEIMLKPFQSSFTIEFTTFEYTFPTSVIFECKLDGYDADWVKLKNNEAHVVYKRVISGKYIFRVRQEGDPASEIQLKISVLPFWWQTWWFRSISVIFVMLIFGGFYILRTKQIREANIHLEKLVKERTATIEQQKNEISGQAEVLQLVNGELIKQKEEIQAVNEELKAQTEELFFTNEELKKLNATKDKFFSIIAHDLKNPFNAILGLSEILYMKLSTHNDENTELSKNIYEASKLTYSLLQNLLEWARSQTNKIKFEPSIINIGTIVSETLRVLNLNAESKKIALINHCDPNDTVYADPNMVTTVVRNIINNSIKFTPEKGSITISTRQNENRLEISIADTGIGMTADVVAKLFRIDSGITTEGTSGERGTGLGLIICKEFVEKNNGTIHVESKVNEGSNFIIKLPVNATGF